MNSKNYLSYASLLIVSLVLPGPACGQGEETATGTASQVADAAGPDAVAQEKSDAGESLDRVKVQFLRIVRDASQRPTALETSVTRFVGKNQQGADVSVDLVGAVHVGERDYYDRLNRLFGSYDAVLYELVAAEGMRPKPGQQPTSSHPISYLQNVMKNVLKLEFQLDLIDYTKSNMVHADMSPHEFAQSMEDRGESFLKMFFQLMGQAMAAQSNRKNAPSDLELLVALLAKDRAYRLKRIMAEQFENMDGQLSVIGGPDGSTIITQRNKKALAVLRQQLGKGKKRLAIFYGAGHLSDMSERLESEFGWRRESQRWLVAWTIEPESTASEPAEDAVDNATLRPEATEGR